MNRYTEFNRIASASFNNPEVNKMTRESLLSTRPILVNWAPAKCFKRPRSVITRKLRSSAHGIQFFVKSIGILVKSFTNYHYHMLLIPLLVCLSLLIPKFVLPCRSVLVVGS